MEKKFKKVKIAEKLPVVMEILQKIDFLMEDERVGISEIAILIEKDPSLTTQLLKLANSPFYGFPKRITSVKTALNFLGVNIVKILLIINNFLEISSQEDIAIWEHLIGVGEVCQLLAKKLNFEDLSTFYTLGLIHDLGLIIEKINFPQEFKKLREEIEKGKDLIETEKEIFNFTHCELGAYLMDKWNFSEKIINPILAHHDLSKTQKYLKESALLYLGDLLVWAKGIGDNLLFKKTCINPKVFQLIPLTSYELKEIFSELDLITSEIKFFLKAIIKM